MDRLVGRPGPFRWVRLPPGAVAVPAGAGADLLLGFFFLLLSSGRPDRPPRDPARPTVPFLYSVPSRPGEVLVCPQFVLAGQRDGRAPNGLRGRDGRFPTHDIQRLAAGDGRD